MATGNGGQHAPTYGHLQNAAALAGPNLSLYTSSQASSSTSSLMDPSSETSSFSGGHNGSSFSPHISHFGAAGGSAAGIRSDRSGPGPSSSSSGFSCPNCGKTFARDDLLRRHLAREARALAQPSFDRQKSCYECARSKARCDLEVPSCGRCRLRGKHCAYAPRSGNPNVRKARNSSMTPSVSGSSMNEASGMAGMSPMGADMAHGEVGADGNGSQAWGMHTSAYGPGASGYVKREGEADYDSTSESEFGRSWNEPYGDRLARTVSDSSSSVNSNIGSPRRHFGLSELPDSAPASLTHFSFSPSVAPGFPPPVRTESPSSYGDVAIGPSMAVGAMHGGSGCRSSGFSRTNTGSIVTNINRQSAGFANDEGEETPIVRVTNSFAQATGLEPRHQANQAAPGPTVAASPDTRQRTASLPQSDGGDSEMSDAWHDRPVAQRNMAGHAPRLHPQGSGAHSLMQPPSLITSNLGRPNGGQMAFPSSMRPSLFTNGLDLSGWLEEPVVPSPLYRNGSGFPPYQFGQFSNMGGMLQSPIIETPVSARFAASLNQFLGSNHAANAEISTDGNVGNPAAGSVIPLPSSSHAATDATADLGRGPSRSQSDPTGSVGPGFNQSANGPQGHELPTAKQFWLESQQSGEIKASLAQLSAACFVSFPSFLVLNDPAAPCPPNIHRRWLQEFRNTRLSFLANARSVLAGYFVRLPASEGFVWKLIADQIKAIIVDSAGLCSSEASEVEVLSAISALWMYLVLLIFTDDTACTQHVDSDLLNSGLCALSELSRSLSSRLEANANTGDPHSSTRAADFAFFSQDETIVRCLFAAYSLLVLQRFREGGELLKSKLAGCDLVLDIPLPAGAAEFEAANEDEWRATRSKAAEALDKADCPTPRPTLRHLLAARKAVDAETQQQQQQQQQATPHWIDVYFDSHDAFANVVLSIALALDIDRL